MSIFAIGDLHLSLGGDKPMDVFKGWHDYVGRLKRSWEKSVAEGDTVVIAGDVSWAMRLENAREDFAFLHSLPGKKIILKGNHDFWWSTRKKLDEWLAECGFDTVSFLFNDSYVVEGVGICGTRGWLCGEEDDAVYARETGRLKRSVDSLRGRECGRKAVFLHYPPIFGEFRAQAFLDIISGCGADSCYYGHLHGPSIPFAFNGVLNGVKYKLISADNLGFAPLKIN